MVNTGKPDVGISPTTFSDVLIVVLLLKVVNPDTFNVLFIVVLFNVVAPDTFNKLLIVVLFSVVDPDTQQNLQIHVVDTGTSHDSSHLSAPRTLKPQRRHSSPVDQDGSARQEKPRGSQCTPGTRSRLCPHGRVHCRSGASIF